MAKKDKVTLKKADASSKKASATTAASADSGSKAKKGGKERNKGKWHGHNDYADDLATELGAVGLRIKDITGDGNCFFRALGDQLEGNEGIHPQLRQRVMSYIAEREEDFAPFVEDDESFRTYVARMKKDGVWAGYMEVVAASRCLGANLTIYQAGQPRWRVINHPEDSSPMLHLSYHDGQHYNSVRAADDFGAGPPAPVVLRGAGTIQRPQRPAADGRWDERDEKRVVASTACTDLHLVRRALEKTGGDVEAAIEAVIEELAAAEETDPSASGSAPVAPTEGNGAGPSGSGSGSSGSTDAVKAVVGDPTWDVAVQAQAPGTAAGAPLASASAPAATETSVQAADQDDGSEPLSSGGKRVSAVDPSNSGGVRGGGTGADGEAVGPCRDAAAAQAEGLPDGTAPPPASASLPAWPPGGSDGSGGSGGSGGGAPGDRLATHALGESASASASAAASEETSDKATPRVSGAGTQQRAGTTVRKKTEGRRVGIAVGGRTGVVSVAASAPSNNKRCPCGSNKKYKACCGPAAAAAERRRAAAAAGGDAAAADAAGGAAAAAGSETVAVAQLGALVI